MSLESPSPSAVIFSFNFDVTVMKSSPARLVDRHCIQPQLPSCEWWIRNHSFSLLPTKQKKTNSQLAFFSPCIDVTWLGSTLSSARKIVPPPPKKFKSTLLPSPLNLHISNSSEQILKFPFPLKEDWPSTKIKAIILKPSTFCQFSLTWKCLSKKFKLKRWKLHSFQEI